MVTQNGPFGLNLMGHAEVNSNLFNYYLFKTHNKRQG